MGRGGGALTPAGQAGGPSGGRESVHFGDETGFSPSAHPALGALRFASPTSDGAILINGPHALRHGDTVNHPTHSKVIQ